MICPSQKIGIPLHRGFESEHICDNWYINAGLEKVVLFLADHEYGVRGIYSPPIGLDLIRRGCLADKSGLLLSPNGPGIAGRRLHHKCMHAKFIGKVRTQGLNGIRPETFTAIGLRIHPDIKFNPINRNATVTWRQPSARVARKKALKTRVG